MVAGALIVLLLALLLTIGVIAGGGESLTVELLGSEVTTSGSGLYFAGLVTGILTLAALWLLRIGLRKGWRQHKRIKDLERRADHTPGPARAPETGDASPPETTHAPAPGASPTDKS
ncbi:hypothetical protein [Jiangella gansuensis]|uniref:hypothetical protein n=1 Tax=Jiangella gansuensis TaxID=281473 RepID=UPI0012F7250C|nr:hypothetical protein [Jiangella gansuensis]